MLLALLFIAVHYAEGIVVGLFHGEAFGGSVPHVGGGGVAGLIRVAVVMAVALIPFFATSTAGWAGTGW